MIHFHENHSWQILWSNCRIGTFGTSGSIMKLSTFHQSHCFRNKLYHSFYGRIWFVCVCFGSLNVSERLSPHDNQLNLLCLLFMISQVHFLFGYRYLLLEPRFNAINLFWSFPHPKRCIKYVEDKWDKYPLQLPSVGSRQNYYFGS